MGAATSKPKPFNQAKLNEELCKQFETFKDFSKIFLDGYALISTDRLVLKFNSMFCTMAGVKGIELRKPKVIDDVLGFSIPGSDQSAIDLILAATSPLRVDEVQALRKGESEHIRLILGSFPFFAPTGEFVGACVLFRDVTAETNLQGKYTEKSFQSVTDPLTGLYTRRYFGDFLEKEIDRARRIKENPALGVLLFDLDKFKNVNDTYGHQAGDYVLQETAKVLRSVARHSDVLGRYGGEEMLALLLKNTPNGVCTAAEKFRVAIESHSFMFEGQRIPVTTSVGVTLIQDFNETPDLAIKRADACLYKAKHAGRNACFADFGTGPHRVLLEALDQAE